MNHIFSVEFATENSIEEAVILENLFYWCNKNKANGTNFFDNDYWTYNSVRAFNKLFPYLSPRKIEGALKRLEQKGYIKIGNYNSNPYDRTKWYAVTEKGKAYFIIDKSITQFCEMDKHENVNEFPQNGKSYKDTDINTDINTDNKKEYKEKEPTLSAKRKSFVVPTVEEVSAYCKERNNNIDAQYFWDYQSSRGWLIGKAPMKDWKAAIRTFEKNSFNYAKSKNPTNKVRCRDEKDFGNIGGVIDLDGMPEGGIPF